jgi:hypothetical protein
MTAKWDVQTERDVGFGVNIKTGKIGKEELITRIRFRKAGSRGRFQTFVVQGKIPADLQQLVDKYLALEKR